MYEGGAKPVIGRGGTKYRDVDHTDILRHVGGFEPSI